MDWVTEYQIKWELEALRSICIDSFFLFLRFSSVGDWAMRKNMNMPWLWL